MTRRAACLVAAAIGLAGCAGPDGGAAPAALTGDFIDDYGIRYTLSDEVWVQHPDTRYHIVHWDSAGQFLIAQNDAGNPADGGRWTRIDWLALEGMAPYDWAFCLSAFDADTRAAAESTSVARRDTPRTGCNGYPFSRMRRPEPA